MNKINTHRDRVYEIARDYIFRSGTAGWSMDDLARDSGITKRTLYKMIDSKETLIEEIITGFIKDVQEKIAAIISGEKDYFTAARRVMTEFPVLAGRMNSRSVNDIFIQYPDVERRVIGRRNELTAGITTFFNRGIEAGLLRNDLTGEFVLQLFQSMVIYFIKSSNGEEEFSRNITTAFDALFNGIKAGKGGNDRKGGKK